MTNSETHTRTCPHCHQDFQNINAKVFSNHVRWCKQNPDRDRLSGSSFHQKIGDINRHKIDLRCGKVKEFTVTCAKCGKQFTVRERENKFPSKEKYYCSRECANSREKPQELRERLSVKAKDWIKEHGVPPQLFGGRWHKVKHLDKAIGRQPYKDEHRICKHCGGEFVVKENSKKRFCSSKCARRYTAQLKYQEKLGACTTDIEKTKLEFEQYRHSCQFRFALNAFPDEFDFDLIRKYGWYKAKNHGDNLTGVSRDHMYSVMDGFVNHVDPKIISHPANCQLLLHSANVSKKDKSSITLEELLNRIDRWNKKYKDFQTQEETHHGRRIQTGRGRSQH